MGWDATPLRGAVPLVGWLKTCFVFSPKGEVFIVLRHLSQQVVWPGMGWDATPLRGAVPLVGGSKTQRKTTPAE